MSAITPQITDILPVMLKTKQISKFRITGPSWEKSTDGKCIPVTKGQ